MGAANLLHLVADRLKRPKGRSANIPTRLTVRKLTYYLLRRHAICFYA
jgi:hypothetical protein